MPPKRQRALDGIAPLRPIEKKTKHNRALFPSLPSELLESIITFLDIPDLRRIAETNKYFHRLLTEERKDRGPISTEACLNLMSDIPDANRSMGLYVRFGRTYKGLHPQTLRMQCTSDLFSVAARLPHHRMSLSVPYGSDICRGSLEDYLMRRAVNPVAVVRELFVFGFLSSSRLRDVSFPQLRTFVSSVSVTATVAIMRKAPSLEKFKFHLDNWDEDEGVNTHLAVLEELCKSPHRERVTELKFTRNPHLLPLSEGEAARARAVVASWEETVFPSLKRFSSQWPGVNLPIAPGPLDYVECKGEPAFPMGKNSQCRVRLLRLETRNSLEYHHLPGPGVVISALAVHFTESETSYAFAPSVSELLKTRPGLQYVEIVSREGNARGRIYMPAGCVIVEGVVPPQALECFRPSTIHYLGPLCNTLKWGVMTRKVVVNGLGSFLPWRQSCIENIRQVTSLRVLSGDMYISAAWQFAERCQHPFELFIGTEKVYP